MAPKKKEDPDAGLSHEQLQAQAQHERLQRKAVETGMVSSLPTQTTQQLPLCKALIKSHGKDIVKKSSNRKNRYILYFNCRIAPAAAGRLGTLTQLDSQNPVLYMDFPQGRLKFFGTLVFPQNKYMVMKLSGGAGPVLCEDVLENLVVFSECWWVGTKEANPEERKLPMPTELLQEPVHDTYDFDYGAGAHGDGADKEKGKQGKGAGKRAASALHRDSDEEDVEEDADEQAAPASASRPRRSAAAKVRYTEDNGDLADGVGDDDASGDSDQDDAHLRAGKRKLGSSSAAQRPRPQQRASQAAEEDEQQPVKRQRTQQQRQEQQERDPDDVMVISSDEEAAPAAAAQATPAAKGKRAGKAPATPSAVVLLDANSDEDVGRGADGAGPSSRGKGRGAASAKKQPASTGKRVGAGGSAAKQQRAHAEDGDSDESLGGSEENGGAVAAPKRTPSRQASTAARRNLRGWSGEKSSEGDDDDCDASD